MYSTPKPNESGGKAPDGLKALNNTTRAIAEGELGFEEANKQLGEDESMPRKWATSEEANTWFEEHPNTSTDDLILAIALNPSSLDVKDVAVERLNKARKAEDKKPLTKTEVKGVVGARRKELHAKPVAQTAPQSNPKSDDGDGEAFQGTERARKPQFEVKSHSIDNAAALGHAMAATKRFFRSPENIILFATRAGKLVAANAGLLSANIQDVIFCFKTFRTASEVFRSPQAIPKDTMALLIANEALLAELPTVNIRAKFPGPFKGDDGRWRLSTPGFDEEFQVFTDPIDWEVDEEMTLKDANAVFSEVCEGMPFKTDRDRAVYLSHAVSILMRPGLSVDYPVILPAFIYRANQSRLGKDIAAQMICQGITGRHPTTGPLSYFKSEKWERKWGIALLNQTPTLHSENNKELEKCTDVLEAGLTAKEATFRRLYTDEDISLPNHLTFSLSANTGFSMTTDMSRRCRLIRLEDPRDIEDIVKSRKTRPDMDAWLKKNQGRFFSAIYAMVRAWDEAGQPEPKDSTFSTGHAYPSVVAGVVVNAGFPNPARDHDDLGDTDSTVDVGRVEWQETLARMHEGLGLYNPSECGWMGKDLSAFITAYNLQDGRLNEGDGVADASKLQEHLDGSKVIPFLQEHAGDLMASALSRAKPNVPSSAGMILGRAFKQYAGTWFGDYRLAVTKKDSNSARVRYAVEKRPSPLD